ncbi:TetR/AcrR family transcriptional regulator [Mycolicibacterium septicum DSM 44393]|uniref:TetR/AcrR family transcriptional regulator n=1 Tax=Mycolicibacterium septicum DSM 44393 TaxID=1341646 RepID=A0A7X6MXA4_9MYCO|nr:TetR family transcriptional regulator [Mycolicibacterium septicum]NKZ15738.1 TetR/AcrR family transcriptional regulator [Mycolicibacterium septicum DSM 44393]
MTRRRLSGAERRAQLLDAARDIVAEDGYPALTIEQVASRTSVTRTVVYQQFTDLAGLTTALLDRESAVAFAGMGSVDQPDLDSEQLGRGILAYLHAAPASWRIILRPPDGAPPELRERIELGRAYARKVAARPLSLAAGVDIDPDATTVRVLLSAIEELARIHLDDPVGHPDDEVLDHLRSLSVWAVATTRKATAG